MSIADKLTTIANNVPLVYEAGAGSSDCLLDNAAVEEYINPRVTYLRAYAFAYVSVDRIKLPNVTKTDSFPFINARASRIEIPRFYDWGKTSFFRNNANLVSVDAGKIRSVTNTQFMSCSSLRLAIFRNDSVASLSAIECFDGTPFASDGAGGIILCLRSLISRYQAATNWSTLYGYGTCTFLALEDYTIDGTATGEPDWEKIEQELIT